MDAKLLSGEDALTIVDAIIANQDGDAAYNAATDLVRIDHGPETEERHEDDLPDRLKTPAAKLLSFTVVNGYLKGDHRCPYELHATGCKDLKQMQRSQQSYEVLAETHAKAVFTAVKNTDSRTKVGDYWVQPCCAINRMRAAGRA